MNPIHTKIRAIITGATGMVGEGVLHECLQHPEVEKVLVINRRPCGITHAKLTEIIHTDFYDITPIAPQLKDYNACFFCLGVSSIGMKEAEYYQKTYILTLHVAGILAQQNPDMTFCYVSGAGTDGTEKGRSMWARVKGKTENDVAKLPFRQVYLFRPGFMKPTPGLKNATAIYKYINWLFPVMRRLAPAGFGTLRELGLAMINSVIRGSEQKVLGVKEIRALAEAQFARSGA
ncbi:NAD-dependent epimerase/dehydratase family protein [Chitinophaga horti]|uniref:NAD-dependent epimerase/dehydratase family protein n=1 Tax=Chitinophaga horti TaxID=2920382 RepID=A0ABY6J319_9BACT|nr:NAD-dependent epimerase/dehydratase family protein [Chitinophaga horti]UYQ94050.1 NAD-dependent epimerase/dehydratase family protein [Chitinophaga horti]